MNNYWSNRSEKRPTVLRQASITNFEGKHTMDAGIHLQEEAADADRSEYLWKTSRTLPKTIISMLENYSPFR